MAHKVLVMSPLHNLGATVAAEMIAQALTFDNKTSTLLFTQVNSLLPLYINIMNVNDPTRSVMQIVKLIDNGAIDDQEILDYAFQYTKNSWLLNVADPSLTGRDREQVIMHAYSRVPTDVVVCDNSEDIDSPLTQSLLDESDMLFIVVDMSLKCRKHLDAWLKSPQLKDSPNVYILVNRYNEVTSAVRNYAKVISTPANRVCKLHYNPWIEKCTTISQLHTVLPLARDLDPRVANLNNDMSEIIQCINGAMVMKIKKGF